jgi:hypothetical protein
MRKEQFPTQWKCKLLPRGDGPFQVLERINNNAYKLDLPGEYNVSATFSVSYLSPFGVDDELDLRRNPSQEERNDDDMASTRSWNADPIHVPIGPVTRAHAKKFHNALSGLIQGIWGQASTWRPIDGDERNLQPLKSVIQVQESQNGKLGADLGLK